MISAAAGQLGFISLGRVRSKIGLIALGALGMVAAVAIVESAMLMRFQPTGAVFPNTNNLGAAMLPAVAIALRYRKRFLAGVFALVMLLTLSRASIAGLMVFAAVYAVRGKHRRWAIAGMAALAGGMLAKSLMPNAGGLDQRLDLWRVALVMFEDNPLMGAGMWSYERYYDQLGLVPEMHGFHAHNLYLQMAAEHGLVGLSSVGIGGLWTLRSMHKRGTRLGAALVIALAVHGLMDYPYWYIPNLMAALIALWVCGETYGKSFPLMKESNPIKS